MFDAVSFAPIRVISGPDETGTIRNDAALGALHLTPPAALFIFLSASTGAGVVPSDFGSGSNRFGFGKSFGCLTDHVTPASR